MEKRTVAIAKMKNWTMPRMSMSNLHVMLCLVQNVGPYTSEEKQQEKY